jgi:RHS repeat-associated protein
MNRTISSEPKTGKATNKQKGSAALKGPMMSVLVLVVLSCGAAAQTGPTITGLLVNGVASTTGPVGASLTIQGSGFGTTMGFSNATLNGNAIAGNGVKPTSWSNTSIVTVIPLQASSGPVIVTVGGQSSNSVSFFIGPVITRLSASSGLAGTGIIVTGNGFGTSGGTVTFNGMAATTSGWTESDFVATVPVGATAGLIVVTVAGQVSNGVSFTPTPSISGLSKTFGSAGTTLTISGNSFGNPQGSGSIVTFNGVSATIGNWTNTAISVTAPSGATTGNVVVSVNGVPSAGMMFTYIPSITSLQPIPVLADGLITIGGNNFGAPLATDKVAFNGVSATINTWGNTSIQAVVPGNVTAGTVVVSVNGVASNPFSFSLTSPYTFSLSYAPNGDVLTVSDSVNGNWVYAYDSFNRLSCSNLSSNGSCGSPTSGNPTYSYTYDQYGNRWQQNGPSTMLLSFTNTQNQMDGYSYDAAGNLLNDGNHSYFYDAENRIVQVDQGQTAKYIYDAQGQRVQKSSGGAVVAEYLHDLSGNTIVELNSSGIWTRTEIYAGGHHLATYGGGATGTTYFVQQDWLGTERARVLPNGDVYETCTSLPFGDGQTCSGGADPSPNHFTGKERDTESGLDNFGARYNASTMGRFMTPDWSAAPVTVPGANLGDPQSLNLYSYVGNNPLVFVDPDGHCWRYFGWLCNIGQRFDNLAHGEGFHTNNGVEDEAHRNNQVRRLQETWGRALHGGNALGPGGRQEIQQYCVSGAVSSVCQDMWSHFGPLFPGGDKPWMSLAGTTYLYEKVGPNDQHLKYGISDNPATRYTQKEMNGGRLKILAQGERGKMLELERSLHENMPIGPEEGQSGYIDIQVEKGYAPPPYEAPLE